MRCSRPARRPVGLEDSGPLSARVTRLRLLSVVLTLGCIAAAVWIGRRAAELFRAGESLEALLLVGVIALLALGIGVGAIDDLRGYRPRPPRVRAVTRGVLLALSLAGLVIGALVVVLGEVGRGIVVMLTAGFVALLGMLRPVEPEDDPER